MNCGTTPHADYGTDEVTARWTIPMSAWTDSRLRFSPAATAAMLHVLRLMVLVRHARQDAVSRDT